MIKTFPYKGAQAGPKFLVLGAVHGNEKCGTAGINRVMDELNSGKLKIARGQVTFVPICNPRAYERDVRYTERNLNRYLVPMEKPDCYEAELGNILCPMLAASDVVLDIHSYTIGGPPFISLEDFSAEGLKLAAMLGGEAVLCGWDDAYAAAGRAETNPNESIGTTGYARRQGATAVLIECGQHKDPASSEVAYHAIRNALRYLNLTDEPKQEITLNPVRLVKLKDVFFRQDSGGKFTQHWQHLQPVKKGDVLAIDGSGREIRAPQDSLVLLPHANVDIGGEWLYLGVETAE